MALALAALHRDIVSAGNQTAQTVGFVYRGRRWLVARSASGDHQGRKVVLGVRKLCRPQNAPVVIGRVDNYPANSDQIPCADSVTALAEQLGLGRTVLRPSPNGRADGANFPASCRLQSTGLWRGARE
jgi:hypothetical protein